MFRLLWLSLTPTFMWFALALVGLDRFTNLSATPLAWIILGVWTTAVFSFGLHAYPVNPEPTYRIERLERNNKPVWVLAGVLFSALMAGLSGAVADRLVKTVAQYLPGHPRQLSGEVTAVRVQSGRGICRFHATVLSSAAAGEIEVCLKVQIREAMGPLNLERGDHVTLQLRDTALGTVVL